MKTNKLLCKTGMSLQLAATVRSTALRPWTQAMLDVLSAEDTHTVYWLTMRNHALTRLVEIYKDGTLLETGPYLRSKMSKPTSGVTK